MWTPCSHTSKASSSNESIVKKSTCEVQRQNHTPSGPLGKDTPSKHCFSITSDKLKTKHGERCRTDADRDSAWLVNYLAPPDLTPLARADCSRSTHCTRVYEPLSMRDIRKKTESSVRRDHNMAYNKQKAAIAGFILLPAAWTRRFRVLCSRGKLLRCSAQKLVKIAGNPKGSARRANAGMPTAISISVPVIHLLWWSEKCKHGLFMIVYITLSYCEQTPKSPVRMPTSVTHCGTSGQHQLLRSTSAYLRILCYR